MNKISYICFVLLLFIYNISEAQVQRVRIDFESPTGYIRPLLLGFDPTNTATDGVDWGWDILNFINIPGDLNWIIEDDRYIVQGVGTFDETKKYPFGLFLTYSGTITISLISLDNFSTPINVYIYDAVLNTYTQINDDDFTVDMPSGDYLDMYYIAFLEPSLSLTENDIRETEVQYFSNTKELYINTYNNSNIQKLSLHNLLGQTVKSWDIKNKPNLLSNEFKIPLKNIADGTYIIKVETNKSTIKKKILINE